MAPASGMPMRGRIVHEVRELLGGDDAVVVGIDVLPVVVRGEVVDRLVALDRRDGVGHVDRGVGPVGGSARQRGRSGDAAAVVGIGRRHGRPGQDAVDAAGVFQADRFLNACLPKLSESVPTGVFR